MILIRIYLIPKYESYIPSCILMYRSVPLQCIYKKNYRDDWKVDKWSLCQLDTLPTKWILSNHLFTQSKKYTIVDTRASFTYVPITCSGARMIHSVELQWMYRIWRLLLFIYYYYSKSKMKTDTGIFFIYPKFCAF